MNDYQMKALGGRLIKTLLGGIRGRIWTGKDSFFDAIAKLIETCKNLYGDAEVQGLPAAEDVLKAMLIEAKKKNMAYKKAAIIALSSVLSSFTHGQQISGKTSPALFLQVHEVLLAASTARHDLLEESEEPTASVASSSTSEELTPKPVEKDENAASLSVRMNALKALAAAWPFSAPATLQVHFESLLSLLLKEMNNSPQFTMRIAALNALKAILPKLDLTSAAPHQFFTDALFSDTIGTEFVFFSQSG